MAQKWDFGSDLSEDHDDFLSDEDGAPEEPRISLKEYRASQESSSNEESSTVQRTQPSTQGVPPLAVSVPRILTNSGSPTALTCTRISFGNPWKGPTSYMNPLCYPTRFTAPGLSRQPVPPPVTDHRHSPVLITGSSPLLRGYPTVESTSPEDDDGWMSDEENATANTLRLDYEQELTFEECLKDIKKLWLESKDQMSQSVRAALHKYFAESANPYVFLSYVVCSFGKGGQKGTHCLPRAILIEFQKWKTSLRGRAKDACELTTGQQQKVLRCVGDHFPHYTDDLFRVFALSTAPLKDRLRTVEDALTAHMFKEAAFYALKLNVRDHFSTRDILLPLIVLDKVNIIQNYLDGSEPLQREFILFLDDTCKHGNERIALLNSSLSEEGVFGKESTSKLSVKQLEKLAQRLIKRYNLPLNDFPHISVMNSRKAFHYILFQRYKMKQISDTNMDELLRAAVEGRSQQEQVLVVTELLRYKDIPAATRLARYCQIPRKFLPQEIRLRLEEEVQFDPSVESHSTSDPGDVFYQLKLPQEKVHWVDGEVSLEECRRHVTMEGQIVAIDGEWRMAACNLGNERLALLQLATEDAIFLLDTLLLEKVVSESKLRRFLADLLTSDKVMKLGYGIDGDFRMLAKSWNFAVDIIGSPKKILDLQLFVPAVQKIVDKFSDISRAKSTPSGDHFDEEHEDHLLVAARGLSLLVLRCFGKPLDKSQQLSDWERRPLRPEQMLYAALDAYCLLEVYHYLREEARAVDPNFDPAPTGPSTQKSVSAVFEEEKEAALRQAQAQANGKPLVTNPPKKAGPQIRPKDLRIIADTMFQGLGRHLRICGVDAKMLSNNSSTYELVKTSIAENRVILTSGKAFFWARNNVPDHLCYHVHSKKPSDQVREVLEYYDVKLTENDILSRCQVCNNDQYCLVAAADMSAIFKALPHLESPSTDSDQLSDEKRTSSPKKGKRNRLAGIQATKCSLGNRLEVREDKVYFTDNNVRLLLDGVPRKKVTEVDVFFICQECGKVFWEGGHFERTLKRYHQYL